MLITQGSEDRALLLAPECICRLGVRAKHLRMMLVVKIRMKNRLGCPGKDIYEPRQIFPPGVMSMIVVLKSKSEDTPAG